MKLLTLQTFPCGPHPPWSSQQRLLPLL
jgi:hypothetical protein